MARTASAMELTIEEITEDGVICTVDSNLKFPVMVELLDRFWELLHVDPSDGRAYYMRG